MNATLTGFWGEVSVVGGRVVGVLLEPSVNPRVRWMVGWIVSSLVR